MGVLYPLGKLWRVLFAVMGASAVCLFAFGAIGIVGREFDLRLMSWGDGTGVPTSGNNLVILGTDNNNVLHIRIFDENGNRVTDTDETKLPAVQPQAIFTLKQQLPGLLPPHVMTDAEKAQVLREATSIAGQTPSVGRELGKYHWTIETGFYGLVVLVLVMVATWAIAVTHVYLLRKFWRVLFAVMGASAVCLFAFGAIVIIGSELGKYHWTIESAFYGLVVLVLVMVATWAVVVMAVPAVRVDDFLQDDSPVSAQTGKRVARHLIRTGQLTGASRAELSIAMELGEDVRRFLRTIYLEKARRADEIIKDAAAVTLVSTAISQNGRYDAMAALLSDFRMIHTIIDNFGSRPSIPQIGRLYVNIYSSSVMASSLENFDQLDEILPLTGLTAIGSLPGAQVVVSSVLQGIANALVTLRLGHMAKIHLLRAGDRIDPREAGRVALRAAVAALPETIGRAAARLPRKLKAIIDLLVSFEPGEDGLSEPPEPGEDGLSEPPEPREDGLSEPPEPGEDGASV